MSPSSLLLGCDPAHWERFDTLSLEVEAVAAERLQPPASQRMSRENKIHHYVLGPLGSMVILERQSLELVCILGGMCHGSVLGGGPPSIPGMWGVRL